MAAAQALFVTFGAWLEDDFGVRHGRPRRRDVRDRRPRAGRVDDVGGAHRPLGQGAQRHAGAAAIMVPVRPRCSPGFDEQLGVGLLAARRLHRRVRVRDRLGDPDRGRAGARRARAGHRHDDRLSARSAGRSTGDPGDAAVRALRPGARPPCSAWRSPRLAGAAMRRPPAAPRRPRPRRPLGRVGLRAQGRRRRRSDRWSQLTVVEAPDLVPAPGQVVIDVEAAGVNFVDALIVEGRYQVKPPLPYTPGSEVAGVDRRRRRRRRRARPSATASLALPSSGGYASQVAVPAPAAVPIPDNLTAGPGGRARPELRHDALRADPPHHRDRAASGSPCSAPAAASAWPPSTWPPRSAPRSWHARRATDKLDAGAVGRRGRDDRLRGRRRRPQVGDPRGRPAAAPTPSSTRSAGRRPSRRCAACAGRGATSWSGSPPGRSRASR